MLPLTLEERRRTGIEPARELVAPSTVLKTAEPTRNPDASVPEATCPGLWSILHEPLTGRTRIPASVQTKRRKG
jgi:hypothetical protein